MRAIPMLRVEVDGTIVRRHGVLHVLQYDLTGKPTVAHVRPQLQPGEVLMERLGQIPAIIMESACLT